MIDHSFDVLVPFSRKPKIDDQIIQACRAELYFRTRIRKAWFGWTRSRITRAWAKYESRCPEPGLAPVFPAYPLWI